MRKLASIQRIWKLEPIEGADRIELASVLGWKCVVNKGQFREMDLAVYFEVDSFLPIRPEFEFLRASSYRETDIMGEGFRLRTMKFRGQISQGLLMPIKECLPALTEEGLSLLTIGQDVTENLGVRKWEIEERATTGGTVIGPLPYDCPHTDETRVQAEPGLIQEFAGLPYYITTKMDGSSHSICIDEDGTHVCGHNYEYKQDDDCSFYRLVNERGYLDRIEDFYRANNLTRLTIQGELCAPGIQQNRLRLKKPEWYVFTIRIDGKRVGLMDLQRYAEEMGLDIVPIEEIGMDLPSHYPTVEDLLVRADGEYKAGSKKEGIVIRPATPVYSKTIGGYLSMKVVSNKYLLKNEG